MIWDSLLFVDQNRNGVKYLKHYLVCNDKCTPISINASDTTEYLGTKTNLASPILQSPRKSKSLRFLKILGIPPLF